MALEMPLDFHKTPFNNVHVYQDKSIVKYFIAEKEFYTSLLTGCNFPVYKKLYMYLLFVVRIAVPKEPGGLGACLDRQVFLEEVGSLFWNMHE